jgi:signal transduction histidine kinase
MCLHLDGTVIEFPPEEVLENQSCRRHPSPVAMLSLPLGVRQNVTGSILLAQTELDEKRSLSFDEFKLMVGVAQELGLSVENALLYQEAQERETMLADLLHQVVGAQEAERQRIARELHDATGQSLTAIALGLRGVETMLEGDQPVKVEQVEELKSFSTSALGELRQIIADLRPSQLDDLGLAPAIQWYVHEFEKRYAIQTEFVVEGNRSRLPPEHETVLFRIVQEALTNIAKHANATSASVRLEKYPAQIRLTIKDDGRGFDLEEALRGKGRTGWGLLGIQERTRLLGGQYEIHSEPQRGTRIQVTVPVKTEAKENVEDQAVAG